MRVISLVIFNLDRELRILIVMHKLYLRVYFIAFANGRYFFNNKNMFQKNFVPRVRYCSIGSSYFFIVVRVTKTARVKKVLGISNAVYFLFLFSFLFPISSTVCFIAITMCSQASCKSRKVRGIN